MLKVYSSVQDHEQRFIYKRLWLNELKSKGNLDWSLKNIWMKVLLENQSQNASEERAPEDDVIRSQTHQKQIVSRGKFIRSKGSSDTGKRWQSTMYEKYNHFAYACSCNHQLCTVSAIHDKNNSNYC